MGKMGWIMTVLVLVAVLAGVWWFTISSRYLPVLMYHKVNRNPQEKMAIHTDRFAEHMKWLHRKGYVTLRAEQASAYLAQGRRPRGRYVVITFDDGFGDNYEEAFRVMQPLGQTGTIFLVSEHIGGVDAWNRAHGYPEAPMLTWEQVREMHQAGWTFGAHTVTHPRLTLCEEAEMQREILSSKRRIEAELGADVSVFCYPYGAFDERVQKIVQQSGFQSAYAVFYGTRPFANDPFALERVGISAGDDLWRFRLKMSPLYVRLRGGRWWSGRRKQQRQNVSTTT